jgi:hypothetical protein
MSEHEGVGVYLGRNDPPQPPDHGFIARLTASAGPSVTYGYYGLPARDGKPAPKLIGDDAFLLEKTSHVRRHKEKLMEFYARTGAGKAFILSASREEIERFCKVVAEQESGYAVEPRPARG